MTPVFQTLESVIPTMDGWCTVPKAHAMAATVFALRPDISVEIGVWGGRSLVALALAHKEIGKGTVWAIDPWNRTDSIQGQTTELDRKWWSEVDHESLMKKFIQSIQTLNVATVVKVIRARSDDVTPPDNIGVLHVDGQHSDQAIKDVMRFAPKVRKGGIVFMDDIGWAGGGVERAVSKLEAMGFSRLYPIETGAVFQKQQ